MRQLLFFLTIFIFACVGPVFALVIASLAYSLFYAAYELVILAALVDVFFGPQGVAVPYFTIATIVWLILVAVCKPRFMTYDNK